MEGLIIAREAIRVSVGKGSRARGRELKEENFIRRKFFVDGCFPRAP
jgi:hypothetical protein